MTVILNEPAIERLLNSPEGPVGQELERRAEAIKEIAAQNISGIWLNIDTQNLLNNLKVEQGVNADGIFYTVGSNAEHGGFRYGGWWDQNGRPWLTEATADVFP